MRLADFEHKDLLATPERLVERFLDPACDISLIETGVDAHALLDEVSSAEGELRGEEYPNIGMHLTLEPHLIEANQMGYRNPKGVPSVHKVVSERLRSVVSVDKVDEICAAARDIRELLADVRPMIERSLSRGLQMNMSKRMRGGRLGHVDFAVATIWFGATQPGLRIGDAQNGFIISDVPVGHVLVWRGYHAMGEDDALRHTVVYRGSKSRFSLIS